MKDRGLGLRVYRVKEKRVGARLQTLVRLRQFAIADALDYVAQATLGEERLPVVGPRVVELRRAAVCGDVEAKSVASAVPAISYQLGAQFVSCTCASAPSAGLARAGQHWTAVPPPADP